MANNTIKDEIDTEIEILGSRWLIIFKSEEEDPDLKNNCGYADDCERFIVITKRREPREELEVGLRAQLNNQKRTLRHELIHAYLSECGLADSSASADAWAANEEMVDWFARLSPKIFETYKALGILN